MYVTPRAVGNAELTFGGIDTTKFTGMAQLLNLYHTIQ